MQRWASRGMTLFFRELQMVVRMQYQILNSKFWEFSGDFFEKQPCLTFKLENGVVVQNEARECFRAFDEANLRANVPISYGRVGDDDSRWDAFINLNIFCTNIFVVNLPSLKNHALKTKDSNTTAKNPNAVFHLSVEATHG